MQKALSQVGSILQCISPPSILVHNVVIWHREVHFLILEYFSLQAL